MIIITIIHTTFILGKNVIPACQFKFGEKIFSEIYYPCRLRLKHGRLFVFLTNAGFYIQRQEVPEGRTSEKCASFKHVRDWP